MNVEVEVRDFNQFNIKMSKTFNTFYFYVACIKTNQTLFCMDIYFSIYTSHSIRSYTQQEFLNIRQHV